jgi:integrase
MPVKLNDSTVKGIAAPPKGSTSQMDAELTGFGLRVSDKGTKQFFFDYRLNGRGRRIAIGRWPAWTATQARARAKELRQLVDKGHDPAGEKRERRDAPTVHDLIERYKRDHLRNDEQRLKDEKSRLVEIEQLLGGDTKVAAVHIGDMQELHRKITDGYGTGKKNRKRPVMANRTLACCSVMFNLALQPRAGEDKPWRTRIDGNPCTGVKRNHEEPSGRLYSPAEMDAIAAALAAYPGKVAVDLIRLAMVTGCRPIEAKRAQWSEFDQKPGYWVKPSSHTKQRKTHQVPLSPPALQLIDRLRRERAAGGDSPVFRTNAKSGTIATHHVWRFVRKHCGWDLKSRLYDLRHSFASIAAGEGASLVLIGKLLGHAHAKTTQRYADHIADDPLQAVTDLVASKIPVGRPRLVSGGQP